MEYVDAKLCYYITGLLFIHLREDKKNQNSEEKKMYYEILEKNNRLFKEGILSISDSFYFHLKVSI